MAHAGAKRLARSELGTDSSPGPGASQPQALPEEAPPVCHRTSSKRLRLQPRQDPSASALPGALSSPPAVLDVGARLEAKGIYSDIGNPRAHAPRPASHACLIRGPGTCSCCLDQGLRTVPVQSTVRNGQVRCGDAAVVLETHERCRSMTAAGNYSLHETPNQLPALSRPNHQLRRAESASSDNSCLVDSKCAHGSSKQALCRNVSGTGQPSYQRATGCSASREDALFLPASFPFRSAEAFSRWARSLEEVEDNFDMPALSQEAQREEEEETQMDDETFAEELLDMEKHFCILCFTRDLGAIALPCMHTVLCKECSAFIRRCPLCSSTIQAFSYIVVNK